MNEKMEYLINRLERVTDRLERVRLKNSDGVEVSVPPTLGGSAASKPGQDSSAAPTGAGGFEAAFAALIKNHVKPLVDLAQDMEPEVNNATKIIGEAFDAQAEVLKMVAACKPPSMDELGAIGQFMGGPLSKASALSSQARGPFYDHYHATSEALSALAWVVYHGPASGMSPPVSHVSESWQCAEPYANKVLRSFRQKDARHADWVQGLKSLLGKLKEYVQKYHHSSPSWNAAGLPAQQYLQSPGLGSKACAGAAAPKSSGKNGPPRAPPPPPPGSLVKERPPASSSGGVSGGMLEVFKDISQGEGVTARLRKVTDSMKTKNQEARPSVVPGSSPSPAGGAARKAAASAGMGTPKVELQQGRRWVVEHQQQPGEPIRVSQTTKDQGIYIYHCQDTIVRVEGKVNTIAIDSCQKLGLLFDSLVASCEVVNSQRIELQCTGAMPSLVIDSVEGLKVYLSKEALSADVATSKSSEINLIVPAEKEDEDMVEHALPEQFISKYNMDTKRFVTVPAQHGAG